ALDTALDIRKFEIENYWKRASYFWTLIAATFIAFGAAQQLKDPISQCDLSVVCASLGIVFSVAWFCLNRGSKYWQMNWEKHVDMLEECYIGPLYKVNWMAGESAPLETNSLKSLILEYERYSPTRINQIVSAYVAVVWTALLVYVLQRGWSGHFPGLYIALIASTVIYSVLIIFSARSGRSKQLRRFSVRVTAKAKIAQESKQ
ncbi:MAG: hypothetical protein ACRD3E_04800, partial [Terriglobales bacterium]